MFKQKQNSVVENEYLFHKQNLEFGCFRRPLVGKKNTPISCFEVECKPSYGI